MLRIPKGYEDYLKSFEWKVRRLRALRDADGKCQKCGKAKGLEVHHLRYTNLGAEPPEDLAVLCLDCHVQEHENPNSKSNRQRAGYEAALDKWAHQKFGRGMADLSTPARAEAEHTFRCWIGLRAKG
jgi:5-methylcytosine-specific restriction endonuclease McrA